MKFQTYKDQAGEYRWRIVARNNRIVADSGQGYSSKVEAAASIRRLIKGVHAMPAAVEVSHESAAPT